MRFILVLLLGIGCFETRAQPAPSRAMPLPDVKSAVHGPSHMTDAWPGIPDATNAWALAIRRRPDWTNVVHASLAETHALALQGSAVAQLKLGYKYFVADEVDRDYGAAIQWLRQDAEAQVAAAKFLLGVADL